MQIQISINLPRCPIIRLRSLWVLGILLFLRSNYRYLWMKSSPLCLPNNPDCKMEDAPRHNNINIAGINSSDSSTMIMTPAEESFSKLELFASAFPGPGGEKDTDEVKGFTEMKSTFIRSLQFFWPLDKIRGLTVVLDDTVCDKTPKDQGSMTFKVKSLFRDDFATKVKVKYNPRSNITLYGNGWYMQQLCMFWADNFTDAEYIGFVDDDTLFTRAVHATELFDGLGRPRAIVRHLQGVYDYEWVKKTYWSLQRPVMVLGMSYFPVIIKRDHLKDIRRAMLEAHPEFSYFDEVFQEMVKFSPKAVGGFSQFCIMMDYCFFNAKDSYSWHFDVWPNQWQWGGRNTKGYSELHSGSTESLGVTKEMLKPFPRVAIHAGYLCWKLTEQEKQFYKTKAGRKYVVDTVLRNGYCYSLRAMLLSGQHDDDSNSKNYSDEFGVLCNVTGHDDITASKYEDINQRGEWTFEGREQWVDVDLGGVLEAHAESMKRYVAQKSIRLRWDGAFEVLKFKKDFF